MKEKQGFSRERRVQAGRKILKKGPQVHHLRKIGGEPGKPLG
jgi:hypothetical protein